MFIYVIQAPGACKVGISAAPQRRLQDIQGAHFEDVSLVSVYAVGDKDAFAAERAAHASLRASYEAAREWFRAPADACCRAVEAAISQAPVDMFGRNNRYAKGPVPAAILHDPDADAMSAVLREAVDNLKRLDKIQRAKKKADRIKKFGPRRRSQASHGRG